MSVVLLLALATGPTASFEYEKGGWIITRVMKDGKPAGTCEIKVYSGGTSPPLVNGETEDGVGHIPPLPGNAGLVGITIDGKECDLIPLSVKDGEVSPPRVLLTFGTRPCCVGATKKPEEPAPPAARQLPPLFYFFLGGSVLLGVAALVLMLRGPKARGTREGAEE
jgi:hypothetical protein